LWLWLVRRRDLGRPLFASVFPEFIAREKPGLRGHGRQGRSAGLVRPAVQRGLGPARLDGQAPQAKVAGESDELGERRTAVDGPGDALKPTPRGERPCVQQARLTGSGQSAWRAIDVVCWPIRRSLFGGPAGRQASRGGRQPTPGGMRSAQPLPDVKAAAKKGAMPPRATTARVRQNSGYRHQRRSGDPALARPPAPVPTLVPA